MHVLGNPKINDNVWKYLNIRNNKKAIINNLPLLSRGNEESCDAFPSKFPPAV